MAATLHDVARRAGVSIKTVSNVINGYPHIRPTTKDRVLSAVDELQYRPNLAARRLRSGRSGMISLIMPNMRNPYFAELADDVINAAGARGLSVLIEQFSGDRESELAALRGSSRQTVDGILYSVLALSEEDAALLDEVPVPVVLLGERMPGSHRDHVTMRNRQAVEAATQHLIDAGRCRILALGSHPGEVNGAPGLRLLGYRDALERAGLPVDDQLIVPVDLWHRRDGAEAMRDVLARGVDFDGVVAFNDSLALGALRVLRESGVDVPGQVALIGFDDVDETRYSLPSLSTIDPGRREIADRAIDLLLARVDETAPDAASDVLTDFRLIERESTAH